MESDTYCRAGMGKTINSSGLDTFGKATPDGKYFFFKNNKSGKCFIYWVDAGIIKALKTKDVK